MSYPYQQYPQYPQFPQPPTGAQPPGIGSGLEPPPTPDPVPPGSTYLPVDPGVTWAEAHSILLTNAAAGGAPVQFGVLIPPPASGTADYPFLMYKQDGTTKAAKDAQDKAKLASQGYSENPPPPDPYALTAQMLQDLQIVWSKAGDALTQLMQLVDQQQKQMQAAGNILGAGQQQGQQQYAQQQYAQQPQQDPWASGQQQAPPPGYPAGD